jgi:BirA family transcriptional regulator, biotin operon repressor / biotin---[acetyl-CoA-carboxylase] ligase
MLSDPILADILARLGLQAPVRFDEVTGSTNATAARLARAGAPQWTLVATSHQTSGRGRLGRSWVDSPGRALLCSVVLRPGLEASHVGLLSLLGGVAMVHAARRLGVRGLGCKWPNDLVTIAVGDGGVPPRPDHADRKVGGILAEADVAGPTVRFVVVGVGMNLSVTPPVERAGAIDVDAADLLQAFLSELRDRLVPSPAFATDVVRAAKQVSATLGRRVRVTTVRGRVAQGEAMDLDESGGLIVRTEAGPETVAFGDVEYLRAQVAGGTPAG